MNESAKKSEAQQQPTIIGEACRIRGDVAMEGDAAILGEIDGSLEVTGNVQIGQGGLVKGPLRAGVLAVEGELNGDVHCAGPVQVHGRVEGRIACAGAVELSSTAVLVGDVFAQALVARDGATYQGHVVIGAKAEAEAERASKNRQQNTFAVSQTEVKSVGRTDGNATETNNVAIAGLLKRRSKLLNTTSMAEAS